MLIEFLEPRRRRMELSKAGNGSIPRKMQLGARGYRNLSYSVDALRKHFRRVRLANFDDARQVEYAQLSFKAALDDEVAAERKSPAYANTLTRAVKPTFLMAWNARKIAEMPRVLDEVCRKPTATPAAKPLSAGDVQKLWKAANDRMKTFITLGLNCGFYAVDISSLRDEHLITQRGRKYIAKRRSKSGAPGKWKLWPVTAKLITLSPRPPVSRGRRRRLRHD